MLHHEVAPPAALQDNIKCLWHTRLNFGTVPACFEVMPDGYAEILFLFGRPCHLETATGPQLLPSPFLMGLLHQPARLHVQGPLDVLGIRCFPWTVFDLLGLSAGPGGVRYFEHPIARLQGPLQELMQAGRVDEALQQLAGYFLLAPPARPAANLLLTKAGRALHAAQGRLPVREVAAAAHATVRTLERQFKHSAGHTVKDVAGLMRFEQVRNRLWGQPDTPLAALADELGYADQAHLSREFRRYSGTTPAAFARKARRTLLTLGRDFVAFVQA